MYFLRCSPPATPISVALDLENDLLWHYSSLMSLCPDRPVEEGKGYSESQNNGLLSMIFGTGLALNLGYKHNLILEFSFLWQNEQLVSSAVKTCRTCREGIISGDSTAKRKVRAERSQYHELDQTR